MKCAYANESEVQNKRSHVVDQSLTSGGEKAGADALSPDPGEYGDLPFLPRGEVFTHTGEGRGASTSLLMHPSSLCILVCTLCVASVRTRVSMLAGDLGMGFFFEARCGWVEEEGVCLWACIGVGDVPAEVL